MRRKNDKRKSTGVSIKVRLFVLCVLITVLPITMLFFVSYNTAKEKLLDAGVEKSRAIIRYTMGILTSYDKLVKEGKMAWMKLKRKQKLRRRKSICVPNTLYIKNPKIILGFFMLKRE